ncbi:uncharacterized protein E0L32_000322 [Thyridium curvatum]|uniref:Uncharacterized protein n=1 Tax=Thyridium curvatum TaxID=1093900 RepID=A0A507BGY7_9PEZI|nr:uncharacterized protein E0L32_000322 [Thyridium curvatum]TPX15988.1 hypothetical protein E0L32_000322 [Thyridium curvatum]
MSSSGNNDETRPYTIPYTGSIAIKQADGSYVASSSVGKSSVNTAHPSAQVKAPVVAQEAPGPSNPYPASSSGGGQQAEEPLPGTEAHAMKHKFHKH